MTDTKSTFVIPTQRLEERKHFTIALDPSDGGTEYLVPLLGDLPVAYLAPLQEAARLSQSSRKKDQERGQEIFLGTFLDILDAYAPGVSTSIPSDVMVQLLAAWQDASEVTQGE